MNINSVNSNLITTIPQNSAGPNQIGDHQSEILKLLEEYHLLDHDLPSIISQGSKREDLFHFVQNIGSSVYRYLDPKSQAALDDAYNKLFNAKGDFLTPDDIKNLGLDTDLKTVLNGMLKAVAKVEPDDIGALINQINQDGYYTPSEIDRIIGPLWQITDAVPEPAKGELQNLIDSLNNEISQGAGDTHMNDVDRMSGILKDIQAALAQLGNSQTSSQVPNQKLTMRVIGKIAI